MTAIVRPRNSVQVLHLLEQCLRRHFASTRVFDDSLMIQVPGVGRVLVTERLALMRLDFVADSRDAAAAAMAVLEEQIQAQVHHQGLAISWDHPGAIPPALR